jgi:hypothetical protein
MIDTMLGMIFVFLAVSLAVTAANELFASIFRWRAKDLEHGIERLLQQQADAPERKADDAPESKRRISTSSVAATLLTRFKSHALIQSLAREPDRFPSYISARTFAQVLLDLAQLRTGAKATAAEMRQAVMGNGSLPPHLQRVLDVLLTEVENDLRPGMSDFAKLQEGVEHWFDGAMDRIGGWYKHRTHWVSFALAVVVAGAMNVDCIDIVQTLSRDTTLRQTIAAQAAQVAQKAPPSPATTSPDAVADTVKSYEALAGAVANIDGLGLPLGWKRQLPTIQALPGGGAALWWWITKIGGLLLTALAASLGAPFWFDLLNRFVSIRSVGKPPSPPEKPKANASSESA